MRKLKPGFTLVELLVVIGIIALLISVLMPALVKAREKAREVQCLSNLRSVGQATQLYVLEHKGRFPLNGLDSNFGSPDSFPQFGYRWVWYKLAQTVRVQPNGSGSSMFLCPSNGEVPWNVKFATDIGQPWANIIEYGSSYSWVLPLYYNDAIPGGPPQVVTQRRITEVKYATEKILSYCKTGQPHGRAHIRDGFTLVCVDGHAELRRKDQLYPGTQQAYNFDHTEFGLKGRDLK